MRGFVWFTAVCLFSLGLLVSVGLMSTAGLRGLLSLVSAVPDISIRVGRVSGRLLDSWQLEDLVVDLSVARISVAKLSGDWRPADLLQRQLHVADISARGVSVRLKAGADKAVPDESEPASALFPLPVALLIGRVLVEEGVVFSADHEELLVIERFEAAFDSTISGSAQGRASLRSPHYGFELKGQVERTEDTPIALEGTWWVDLEGYHRVDGDVRVGGTLERADGSLSVRAPAPFTIGGRVEHLLKRPTWDLAGGTESIELQSIHPDWPEARMNLQVKSAGRFDDYHGSLSASYSRQPDEPFRIEMAVAGDQVRAEIVSAEIAHRDGRAHLRGVIDYRDTLSWEASASVQSLDLSEFAGNIGLLVEAELRSQGTWSSNGLDYFVEIDTLTGELRDPALDFSGSLHLQGDAQQISLSQVEITSGAGSLRGRGNLGWGDGLSWQTNFDLHQFEPARLAELPEGRISAGITAEGRLVKENLSLAATLSSLSGELAGQDLSGSGSIEIDNTVFVFSDVDLFWGENSIHLEGSGGDEYDLQLTVDGADLGVFYPEFEGRMHLAGTLHGPRAEPAARLDFSWLDAAFQDRPIPPVSGTMEVRLSEDLRAAESISSDIAFAGSTAAIKGTLDWRTGFSWNSLIEIRSLKASTFNAPLEAVADIDLSLSGKWQADLLEYRADFTDIQAEVGPSSIPMQAAAQLKGDFTGLELSSAELHIEDGSVQVSGLLNWSGAIEWEARLGVNALNPQVFGALPEGSINAELSGSGKIVDGSQQVLATIDHLSGILAGYELEGGGALSYVDNSFQTDGLYLQNGANRLDIAGLAGSSYGLSFRFQGNELSRLYPQLAGVIEASGTISGSSQEPEGQIGFTAKDLAYQDHFIATLSGNGALKLSGDNTLKVSLAATGLKSGAIVLDRLKVELAGTPQQHRISLNGNFAEADFGLAATGGVQDTTSWEGIIDDLSYEHRVFGPWRQRTPSRLTLSTDGVWLEALCIDSGEHGACVEGTWQSAGNWRFDLAELRFDLADLYQWGLLTTAIEGKLQGQLSSTGSALLVESMHGTFRIPELEIRLDQEELFQNVRWLDTELSVNLDQSRLQTVLSSRAADGSNIDGEISINGFGNLAEPLDDLELQGHGALDIKDLSLLKALTGDYLVPTGHLVADLAVGGVVAKPELTGHLELQGGALQFPQLGTSLTDMQGEVQAGEDGLTISLDAVCGEGTAQGSGTLRFGDEDWRGAFLITGSDCQVMNVPELAITASPELELVLGSDGGRLTGSLMIPRALIKPEMMTGAKSESTDVVFVGEQGGSSRWPFNYELTIELGDDIAVDGYGLNANLAGGLSVSNKRTMVTGRGVLDVTQGTFTIFGKPLKIARGRLGFSGGPIDNPTLDVSARKVIGTNQFGQENIVVGVNVIGTVADFEIELFSIPPMKDQEIVTYILFDKSFASSDQSSRGIADSALQSFGLSRGSAILGSVTKILPVDDIHIEGIASDDASLVVGRSLTERLSVSYDFNLFNNSGIIKVRYEFGKGFSVQSRNAFDTNGIELLYSFER